MGRIKTFCWVCLCVMGSSVPFSFGDPEADECFPFKSIERKDGTFDCDKTVRVDGAKDSGVRTPGSEPKPKEDESAKEPKEKPQSKPEPRAETPKEQTPSGDEGPLTIYDPNSPKNIEKQRQQADLLRREEEVRRRENAARDAQNAQLQEERSVGHVRPGGYDNNFAPEQVYQQGPIIDPSVAERLLAVKALAQDPRIPAAVGNQVITLLLNIDPQFNNVGPIVAQAEKILDSNGANKKLFADVVDANKVTAKSESVVVEKQEKTITNNNSGKAYRQDELLVKVPTDILATGEKNIAKGGNVNMLVVTPKGASANGQGGSGNSGGQRNSGNQSLADELLAGLVLRQEDSANPSRKNVVTNRGIASADAEDPLMPAPRISPVEAPRSKRIGILLMLVAAVGAGFLLFGKLKKRTALAAAKNKDKAEPTAEMHAPEQATSATKIAPSKSKKT